MLFRNTAIHPSHLTASLILILSTVLAGCNGGLPAMNAAPGPADQASAQTRERPTLQWEAPLAREDRSRLHPHEISSYRVYFRLRHQEQFRSTVVEANQLPLSGFTSGAYEFAVSTIDRKGRESRRSAPVPVDLI